MQRWTCPHCESNWNLADDVAGKVKCPKCKATSEIDHELDIDFLGFMSDETTDPGRVAKSPATSPRKQSNQAVAAGNDVQIMVAVQASLFGVTLSTACLWVICVGLLLPLSLFLIVTGGPTGLFLGIQTAIVTLLTLAVASPLIDGVNEIHRCRKLLEIVAQRRRE